MPVQHQHIPILASSSTFLSDSVRQSSEMRSCAATRHLNDSKRIVFSRHILPVSHHFYWLSRSYTWLRFPDSPIPRFPDSPFPRFTSPQACEKSSWNAAPICIKCADMTPWLFWMRIHSHGELIPSEEEALACWICLILAEHSSNRKRLHTPHCFAQATPEPASIRPGPRRSTTVHEHTRRISKMRCRDTFSHEDFGFGIFGLDLDFDFAGGYLWLGLIW